MINRRQLGIVPLGLAGAAVPGTAIAAGLTDMGSPIAIARDTVIADDIAIVPGTVFHLAAGTTLVLTGDFVAPARQIFAGPGRVDLMHSRVVAARPEWWGAAPGDPAVDCAPALHACLAAHATMQLGAGDYHIAGPLRIDRPNRRVWGVGRSNGLGGTRLVRRGGRGSVVIAGTEHPPATINNFVWGLDLRWIELARTAAPEADGDDEAIGLTVRHVVDCVFEGLRAAEHAIGFSLYGAVRTFLRDCSAFRSTAHPAGRDTFVGFDMDGRVAPAAIRTGANASLYLIDCLARTGGNLPLAKSIGCRLTGALSDCFIDRFETASIGVGILIDGRKDLLDAGQLRSGHIDLHIRGAVLDQCSDAGIRLTGLSDAALVDIGDPYVALAPGGTAALDLNNCGGDIGIIGGQLIGPSSPAAGIRLRSTSGVAVSGTKLAAFARPVEAVASTAFDLAVGIDHRGPATGGPAILLTSCTHGFVRPRITGSAGVFDCGVTADGRCDAVDIATSAIVPAALADGAAVRVDGHAAPSAAPGHVYLTAR